MSNLSPQFITDEKGKRVFVILPVEEYQRMVEELEELEDIRLYEEAKSRNEETMLLSEYIAQRRSRKNG